MKVAYLKHNPWSKFPYAVQIFKAKTILDTKGFITKPKALEWISLNHPTAEVKDLTGKGTTTPRCYS